VIDFFINKITNGMNRPGPDAAARSQSKPAALSRPHLAAGNAEIAMGRKRVCDPEVVLEAFARRLPLAEISKSIGGVPIGTLGAIIHRARKAGDPRAALRQLHTPRRASAAKAEPGPVSGQIRRRRLAREFPASTTELENAIARASVPVRRLRPGIATWGWRPSWLRV
jgi:hypothetical protein